MKLRRSRRQEGDLSYGRKSEKQQEDQTSPAEVQHEAHVEAEISAFDVRAVSDLAGYF